MKILKSALILCSLICSFAAKAQDPEFTQTMATPMYFNPAFAGIQGDMRAGLHYRNQWPSVSGAFTSILGSAEMGFSKINSGVGLYLMHDQAGDGSLSTNTISAFYSYDIRLGIGSHLRFGLNPSLFNRTLDMSQLRFGNQIDPKTGFKDTTYGGIVSTGLIPNLSSGVLFYTGCFYGGMAVYNMFEPAQSFFGNPDSKLLRRYDLQAGGFISLGPVTLNPNILMMHQGNFTQILSGVNVTKGKFTFGTSYRHTDPNADAVNFLIGFKTGSFKFCYSYDLTVSDARAAAAGSHELSVIFQLGKPGDTSDKLMVEHMRNAY